MRHLKKILIVLALALLPGTRASAADPYIWVAKVNADLYSDLMTYLKTAVLPEQLGEPVYYMTQQLVVELEAGYRKQPYLWMTQVHNFCNTLEAMYPPSLSHPSVSRYYEDSYDKIRHHILRLRDYPMHQVTLESEAEIKPVPGQADAFHAANKQWLQLKRSEFFQFLHSPRPTGNELQIVKLYSSGCVFRTKDACIGIDLCYGEGLYDGVGKQELADMLDAVYVTHAHGDHYDIELLKMVLQRGKAVVGPSTMARHLEGVSGEKHLWSDSHLDIVRVAGVADTQAYMSGQGDEPCLLYLIQVGDWRLVHVGDNSNHAKEALIYPNYPIADVVLAPIFEGIVNLLTNTLAGPNPNNVEQIYVNVHENEWHHEIHGRISYEYLFNWSGALNNFSFVYPGCALLDNGEHLTLYK